MHRTRSAKPEEACFACETFAAQRESARKIQKLFYYHTVNQHLANKEACRGRRGD